VRAACIPKTEVRIGTLVRIEPPRVVTEAAILIGRRSRTSPHRKAMRSTSLIAATSVLVLAGVGWLTLQAEAAPRPVSSAIEPADAAIKQAMDQIDSAVKALGKPITADTKAAALEELTKLQTAVIAAKSQTPGSAAKVDEKKRAAFVADYRKTLIDVLKVACDAEIAIADGKFKDADKLINNKLSAFKSSGHSKYKE
jgi:hypothetical protein